MMKIIARTNMIMPKGTALLTFSDRAGALYSPAAAFIISSTA
jgi:hypothetical protein